MLMLNAKNKTQVFAAFRDGFPIGSQQRKYTNHFISGIMSAIKNKHKKIVHYFCTDIGVRLMNLDSNIAELVIEHFSNQNIPILSVHDSFISDRQHMTEMERIMRDAFKKVVGVPLSGGLGQSIKSNWSPSEQSEKTKMSDRYIRNLRRFCAEQTEKHLLQRTREFSL
ncbi:DNA-directed RNA polymerase [Terasakiella sp. A23]|uniref:DNA-directed RNA polymerase n=1 Tax=Terasakiella sp. FCG-A23 TaxID=3080561 RepID=UPI002952F65B|nr:DNA-directed RNA polymerase [Terasakiella sp. A23]MDV7341804.1 DNA-directed RNA polymerase [Terasakiella sp. A23]